MPYFHALPDNNCVCEGKVLKLLKVDKQLYKNKKIQEILIPGGKNIEMMSVLLRMTKN